MAVKISVTKAMEERIRKSLDDPRAMEHCGTLIRQLVSLIDDAHDKKTRKAENGGLDPMEVVRTIKGVLGGKASMPPNPGAAFFGYIKSRTKFLNVSLQDIERAAVHLRNGQSKVMRLPNSIEWIIRRLDQLLEEADQADQVDLGFVDEREEEEPEWGIVTGRE